MEPELIIKSIMGLVVVLAILMFFLFFEPKKGDTKRSDSFKSTEADSHEKPDLKSLVHVIKNRKSDADELKKALGLIIKYYGTINKKLGIRPHPDLYIYMDILFAICRHPNTNKDIILEFDKDLEHLNPEYKKEINEAIAKGLNSRGA
jgi:hypothetical protein